MPNPAVFFQSSSHLTSCCDLTSSATFLLETFFYIVSRFLFCFWLFFLPLCWSIVCSVLQLLFFTHSPWVISFSQIILYTIYKLMIPTLVSPAWTSFEWHASLSSYWADYSLECWLHQFKSPKLGLLLFSQTGNACFS